MPTNVPGQNKEHREASRIASLQDLKAVVASDHSTRMIEEYLKLGTCEPGVFQIPKKSDFDPVSLGASLANVVLYDLHEEGKVVFRLVGENMRTHFNANPIGRSYLDFLPPERQPIALAAFRHCVELPCVMLSRTCNLFEGQVTYCFEAVGFPFLGDDPNLPARYLLFMDTNFEPVTNIFVEDSEFPFSAILERHFVDLGNGTPDRFIDIVRTDIHNPFADREVRATT